MKPYYHDDWVTIYHGHCGDVIVKNVTEWGNIDLVLTDPPYGLGDKWQGGKAKWPLHHGQMAWDASRVEGLAEIIKIGRQQIVWGGHLYPLPIGRGWLVWDKLERNDAFTSGQGELAWTNLEQPVKIFRKHLTAIMSTGKVHPTQKPIQLMTWCMKFTDGGTVLDPFMGSGTTLRAAKDLKRRAIGIEIEEKYCEIAARRMSQEVLI